MQPTQLTHLREAAADIRNNFGKLVDRIIDLKTIEDQEGRNLQAEGAIRDATNIERALTRIEMCLREIK